MKVEHVGRMEGSTVEGGNVRGPVFKVCFERDLIGNNVTIAKKQHPGGTLGQLQISVTQNF